MKKIFCVLLLCLALPNIALGFNISINQFVEHPSLDASVRGFKDQLKEEGLEVHYKLHVAQANIPTTLQIVGQIIGEKPDLVLAVATPSAQACAQKIHKTPVLFTAVTDPLSAGLVKNMERPGKNISGTTDIAPVRHQFELIREIDPKVTRIGIIYNSGEANSIVQLDFAKQICRDLNIKVIEASTPNSSGVYQAAKSLVGKVDAIYLPTDNTVISNIESIVKICVENKIPLYTCDSDSVGRGAVATQGIDFYNLGRQTGKMAARILRDKADIGNMPVEGLEETTLVINPKAAAQMGVTLPQSVLDRAGKVIE